jgi:hypothetical protein
MCVYVCVCVCVCVFVCLCVCVHVHVHVHVRVYGSILIKSLGPSPQCSDYRAPCPEHSPVGVAVVGESIFQIPHLDPALRQGKAVFLRDAIPMVFGIGVWQVCF